MKEKTVCLWPAFLSVNTFETKESHLVEKYISKRTAFLAVGHLPKVGYLLKQLAHLTF